MVARGHSVQTSSALVVGALVTLAAFGCGGSDATSGGVGGTKSVGGSAGGSAATGGTAARGGASSGGRGGTGGSLGGATGASGGKGGSSATGGSGGVGGGGTSGGSAGSAGDGEAGQMGGGGSEEGGRGGTGGRSGSAGASGTGGDGTSNCVAACQTFLSSGCTTAAADFCMDAWDNCEARYRDNPNCILELNAMDGCAAMQPAANFVCPLGTTPDDVRPYRLTEDVCVSLASALDACL